MHTLLQNPWTEEANSQVLDWLQQALDDGVITDDSRVTPEYIMKVIRHNTAIGNIPQDMSRDDALILFSVWVGRSFGARNG